MDTQTHTHTHTHSRLQWHHPCAVCLCGAGVLCSYVIVKGAGVFLVAGRVFIDKENGADW